MTRNLFLALLLGAGIQVSASAQSAAPAAPEKAQMAENKAVEALPAELELIRNALSALGVKYKMGGRSEAELDCSGFVKKVFEQTFGMILPPTAKLMSQVGSVVKADELKVGDLIFFNTLRRPFSHVGLYLGEGRFIHASSLAKQVKIDTLNGYYQQRIDGYRRVNPK